MTFRTVGGMMSAAHALRRCRTVDSRTRTPMAAAEQHEAYDPLYLQGIEKFNECDYYESHEIWEELWTEYRGPSRKFYQALIQAAVALYHFGNGNIRGARKLHASVHGYMEPYAPVHLGLDVTAFLGAFDACLAEVASSTEEFPSIELNPELLPEIHLDPPPA
jgi:hypothetical protein